ncbi:DNA replication/repair protein RecF [Rhodobacteraceae bacterium XHP0102]|nr:DNA replication/repair protein RecF [Rhodobacteraceae bacterium XHP0102]
MTAYISALHLSHFRSHLGLRLAFDGRPVTVYGPNGAGKTNILEAISMLSPGRGLRRAPSEDLTRRPEGIGWRVAATLEIDHVTHEVVTRAEPGNPRQVEIDEKSAPQLALARLLRMVWLVPSQDRLWIEGAEGRRRFLDRITLSFFPEHGEAVLAYEKAMRDRNRLLKDQARDTSWYSALERQMMTAAAQIHANRQAALTRIAAAQEQAETSFPIADLTLEEGDGFTVPDDLARFWAETRARDMAAGRTLVGPHRTDLGAIYRVKDAPARQCSTGEQKALLVSLILANARALKQDTGRAPLVLLDEVAAHLDAARRAALFDEICALNAQAFLTGTGAELFMEFGTRAQDVPLGS